MALPRATGSTSTHKVGPFISSGGAAYFVNAPDGTATEINVRKSANPDTTAFAQVGTVGNPSGTGSTAIADIDAYQVGDVLHIACLSYTTPAMGDWTWYWDYWSFDMSDDSWDTSTVDSTVWNTACDDSLTTGQISIMVRGSDGDIVIVGKGPDATDMGTAYDTLYHGYYNGTSWSTPTRVDGGAAGIDYNNPGISDEVSSGGSAGDYENIARHTARTSAGQAIATVHRVR